MYIDKCEIEQVEEKGKVKVKGPGILTGEEQSVIVNEKDLEDYKNGALAQDAFPYLSGDEREFLISGVDIGKFDQMF